MGKNVAVFVDVANIFYAAKAAGVDVDYVNLLKHASSGRDLVRAYAYTGLDPDNENQRNFHSFLSRHGYKVVSKDIKIRTFIGQESMRNQLASHVYDITYGSVKPGDNLVCVDDSIVRGTTLRKSILRILARLNPRKIIVVSTAPQIRYPDCYGIDMSELGKFVAFEAAVSLIKERGQAQLLDEVYELCREEVSKGGPVNHVRRIYEPVTAE